MMVDFSLKIHLSSEGQSADGYCLPVENYATQYISSIKFDQAKLLSGFTNSSYKEVDYDATNFQAGITHSINLIPEPSNDTKEFLWTVWLDVNGNKDFENDELLFQGVSDANGITGTVAIPLNAISAKTRMRISLGKSAVGGSCSYVEYGQIVDFTLMVDHLYCTNFPSLNGGNSGDYYIYEFATPKLSKISGQGPYSEYTALSPFIDMYCVSSWTYDGICKNIIAKRCLCNCCN